MSNLQAAYDTLEWGTVQCSPKLEVPVCQPARFSYVGAPTTDTDAIEQAFDGSELVFIDVHAMNGDAWYEFNVSATVFDETTNESAKVSLSTAGASVFTKDDLSFESFGRIVDALEDAIGTELEFGSE